MPLSIVIARLSLGEKVKFYDFELLLPAKKNNLTACSPEAVEREAEALNKFSMDEQVKALLHTVSNFEAQKKEFQELMVDYRKGNLEEKFKYNPTSSEVCGRSSE